MPHRTPKDASEFLEGGGTPDELNRAALEAPPLNAADLALATAPDVPIAEPATVEPAGIEDDAEIRTELGNAQRFVKVHGRDCMYCTAMGKWFVWRRGRWVIDSNGQVVRWMKKLARRWWDKVKSTEDERERKAIAAFATESERAGKIDAALKLASTEASVVVASDQLDADPFLLGCPTGVVELQTGKFRPGDRADRITKSCAVDPADKADCPLWRSVVSRAMNGNAALVWYLQKLLGLFLTGDISVQEFWIFWGAGANGKSTIVDTMTGLLADYATIAPESLLTAQTHAPHPTEIMPLLGARLAVANETERGATLRIQAVKKLTGDSRLTGRYCCRDFVTFPRTHKTLLVTNEKPKLTEHTEAVKRRLRLVPFTVTIPPAERDAKLLAKLKRESPAILRWCIDGYLAWQRDGLTPPPEILAATDDYFAASDSLGEYAADRLALNPRGRITRGDLHNDYLSYCQQAGDKFPASREGLFDRIRQLSSVTEKQWRPAGCSAAVRGFSGVELAGVATCSIPSQPVFTHTRATRAIGGDCDRLLHDDNSGSKLPANTGDYASAESVAIQSEEQP